MVVLKADLRQLKPHSILFPALLSLKRPHQAITTIHQSYGDLVLGRFFNKKLLFISHPEHIEEVYAQEARGLLSRDFLYDAKKSLFGDGLINSKTEIWTNQRRLLQPLFFKEAVSEWESIISSIASARANQFKGTAPQEINLSNELRTLIQRIFIQILMGSLIDDLPEKEPLMAAVGEISKGLLLQMISQIISDGKLMKLMPNKNRQYQTAVAQLYAFVNKEIASRKERQGHDLISLMLKATDKKSGYVMTPELLQDETVNLLFAGQDTTINTLSWFFYLIGKDAEIHKKITEEILKHKAAPITAASLEKLVYTKAALLETLRLYPSSPALATQAVADVVIGGYPIAAGTTILLSTYVTHRHPVLWERPNEFYPEHFLNNTGQVGRHKYSFYPFGGGLHNCIGRHFVELEMMIVIVTLLREFTFKTKGIVKEAASITLKPDRDIIATLKPLPD
ncbi:putative cytochrome [Methyloglobulus morosus KoM1]|uniref:Putative cytochrome n=1 Tax=Methyloglobulus morosus KoM1 TaxID=1116472 RepID=V5BUY5_9GAMM|nr:cytochrome P450 [Methyloglobulus morosus]ESS71679.1 putative cytochrome [Methyloglobulus morosus KoM1]